MNHVDSKLEEMRTLLLQDDKTQAESGAENKVLVEKLEQFASHFFGHRAEPVREQVRNANPIRTHGS